MLLIDSYAFHTDTVNGFSFHPFLPMAASSSGHRRFDTLDDSPEDLSLSGISIPLLYLLSCSLFFFFSSVFVEIRVLSCGSHLVPRLAFVGDENCASVWSFAFASMEENAAVMDCGDLNSPSENKIFCSDP